MRTPGEVFLILGIAVGAVIVAVVVVIIILSVFFKSKQRNRIAKLT